MEKATTRAPMTIKNRAKQFAMFDALKGLTEAIAEKEQLYYPRRELTEDRIAELEMLISSLQVGSSVDIAYYCNYSHRYKMIIGVVSKVDRYWKQILVNDVVIEFCDVYDIVTGANNHLESY